MKKYLKKLNELKQKGEITDKQLAQAMDRVARQEDERRCVELEMLRRESARLSLADSRTFSTQSPDPSIRFSSADPEPVVLQYGPGRRAWRIAKIIAFLSIIASIFISGPLLHFDPAQKAIAPLLCSAPYTRYEVVRHGRSNDDLVCRAWNDPSASFEPNGFLVGLILILMVYLFLFTTGLTLFVGIPYARDAVRRKRRKGTVFG